MLAERPLDLYRTSVKPEWIDCNGHMNVAYYVLVFGFAADAKRIHLFYDMTRESDGARLVTYELLALHVDQAGPRVTSMPALIRGKAMALAKAHAPLAVKLPHAGSSRILLAPKPR